MALFDFGKKKKVVSNAATTEAASKQDTATHARTAAPKKNVAARVGQSAAGTHSTSNVLVRPRITEKASFAMEGSAYVFDVAPHATKTMIREAVERHFNVTPRKVNIVTIPRKLIQSRSRRGLRGVTAAGKKAYVYLKSGDSIDTAV